MIALRPPAATVGERLTITPEVQIYDTRNRDRDQVSDIVGRWIVRYVRRTFPEYEIEGWSPEIDRGRTYLGWWFGRVEVYVVRRAL